MPRRRRCAAPSPIPGEERPVQRNAANARERARMRVLSKAFCRLKTTLPWVPADTKLSKLDTLRLATSYIAHLRAILTDEGAEVAPLHPLNLTWPFSFQQQSQGSLHGQGQQGWQESRNWTPTSLERGASSTDHDMDDDDDEEEESTDQHHRHHSTYHHHHHHHHHQFSDSLLHLG